MLKPFLQLLLAAPLFAAPLAAQIPSPVSPSPEAVQAAVTRLEQAFTKGKTPERLAALQAAVSVPDAKVIEWIVKGLRDPDAAVQTGAVESLRFMPHPAALEGLHAYYKQSSKRLAKDEAALSGLLKAIAQHASKSSIDILADNTFGGVSHPVIEARILGLGNIRTVESAEALFALMRSAGRVKLGPYMPDLRLALMRITGADQGHNQEAWLKWWSDHKQGLKVPAQVPLLPPQLQNRWDYYWGNDVARERQPGRGERGKDPEKGGDKKGSAEQE